MTVPAVVEFCSDQKLHTYKSVRNDSNISKKKKKLPEKEESFRKFPNLAPKNFNIPGMESASCLDTEEVREAIEDTLTPCLRLQHVSARFIARATSYKISVNACLSRFNCADVKSKRPPAKLNLSRGSGDGHGDGLARPNLVEQGGKKDIDTGQIETNAALHISGLKALKVRDPKWWEKKGAGHHILPPRPIHLKINQPAASTESGGYRGLVATRRPKSIGLDVFFPIAYQGSLPEEGDMVECYSPVLHCITSRDNKSFRRPRNVRRGNSPGVKSKPSSSIYSLSGLTSLLGERLSEDRRYFHTMLHKPCTMPAVSSLWLRNPIPTGIATSSFTATRSSVAIALYFARPAALVPAQIGYQAYTAFLPVFTDETTPANIMESMIFRSYLYALSLCPVGCSDSA
ncbi:hypothetical protein C8R43DRAFT_1100909 [Mycena crocata]|nr:hypothetical protein C8R43DRAFT_1100909 [Mycena crocata]